MAKRSATTDLNHDNWNEEETPEEAGTFAQASAEDLEKRTLKVAKRRISATAVSDLYSHFFKNTNLIFSEKNKQIV